MKTSNTGTVGRRGAAAFVAALAIALSTLFAAPAAQANPNQPNIGLWSTNHDGVRCAQWAYNSVAGQGLDPDGQYGPLTEQATRNWQRFFGLSVDGVIGKDTGQSIIDMVFLKFGTNNTWALYCPYYLPSHRSY
ncbi:peptidoglycan-binding domain-containing protein [Streptodolium elevatio]|uniref:Peptidoglycan-binding domain-containing protein n=1 Tax=Streptodolium elevatio TaxID=3157996 RepID=A0ABV3DPE2_9ACTN